METKEPTLKLELTKADAETLLNLLDLMVRATGLQNAQVALHFAGRLQQAATEAFARSGDTPTA